MIFHLKPGNFLMLSFVELSSQPLGLSGGGQNCDKKYFLHCMLLFDKNSL